jgi:hypothetical protein
MKRLDDRGLDALTFVHKLTGLVWLVASLGVLAFTVPSIGSGDVAWHRVALLGRFASSASVVTLVLAVAYGVLTVWGFLGSRWFLAKWGLYLVAVGASGYAIRATREEAVGLLVVLASVQLLSLGSAMGIGVHLVRSRRKGVLPMKRRIA